MSCHRAIFVAPEFRRGQNDSVSLMFGGLAETTKMAGCGRQPGAAIVCRRLCSQLCCLLWEDSGSALLVAGVPARASPCSSGFLRACGGQGIRFPTGSPGIQGQILC